LFAEACEPVGKVPGAQAFAFFGVLLLDFFIKILYDNNNHSQ